MIFTARMTKTLIFNIKADGIEEAQEWCQTHNFEDVEDTSACWNVSYFDEVGMVKEEENVDNNCIAIDISN